MKATIIAGCVTLSVLNASAAHADTLPDAMMGEWCYATFDEQLNPTFNVNEEQQLILTRRINHNCSANNMTIIHQDGSDDEDGSCTFDKIEQIRANAFLVYFQCKGADNTEEGSGPKTLEIIDDKLIITPLSEG